MREGLAKVDSLGAGRGFFDLSLGVAGRGNTGTAEARAEVGYKLTPTISTFGFASAGLQYGGLAGLQGVYGLGAGLRGTF